MQSAITTKNHIQKLHLYRTLSIRNGELWCNESHPLLLNYLKTLLEYIYKMKGIYEVICQPLWCHSGQEPSDSIAKDSQKYKILGVTLSLVNGRMGRKKSHPLLPKCCKTIIVCPYKTWDTSGLILHTIQWDAKCHHNQESHSKATFVPHSQYKKWWAMVQWEPSIVTELSQNFAWIHI